ncbi:MAG: hypothetical protein Q9191_006947, partial [Dirinaria sp. TL-2023a]
MGGKIWSGCEAPTQRLSKPKTNTSSSNLQSLTSQRSEPSTPVSPIHGSMFDEDPVVTSQTGDRRSRQKSRSKIRTFLHGSGNETAAAQSSDEDDNGQQGLVSGIRKRLSRGSSYSSQYTHRRQSSAPLSNKSSSALLLDDSGSARTEHKIKEKEYMDRAAAQAHVSLPIDADKRPRRIKAPIRRRSLYTPGLATRTPHDMLRRPPPPDRCDWEAERQYYFNPDRPRSSPLSELAALAESRSAALALSEGGRSTPVGFSQLGGLGLGTLRITNGAASPEPSIASKPLSDCASHDEYFTASEGCKSDDEAQSIYSRAVNETPRPRKRADSPLKFESCRSDSTSEPVFIPRASEPLPDPKYHFYPENGLHQRKSDTESMVISQSPTSSYSIAQEYMSELPPSPYARARSKQPSSGHPRTQDTDARPGNDSCVDKMPYRVSRNSCCFQDEGVDVTEAHSSDRGSWRNLINGAEGVQASSRTKEDAYRILNGDILPRGSTAKKSCCFDLAPGDREVEDRRESSSTTTTTNTTPSVSGTTKLQTISNWRTSAGKNDSGYSSSNASLARTGDGSDVNGPQPANLRDFLTDHRSISGSRDMLQQSLRGLEAYPASQQEPATLARPSLTVVPRPATTVITTTTTTTSSPTPRRQHTAPTTSTSSALPINDGGQSRQVPQVKPTVETSCRYPITPPLTEKRVQRPVPISPVLPFKPRKLHKPQRLSSTAPADQLAAEQLRSMTEVDIPPIPPAVASKHAERLRDFPSLEHTYPSLHHTNSNTCRSPSPAFTNFVPIRFPSPANSMEDRSDAIVNSDLGWPTTASKKKAKELKEQSKRSSKGARRQSQPDPTVSIADFGDVGESIGKSVYDVARAPVDSMKDRSDAIVNGNLDWPTKESKKKAKELKEQSRRSSQADRRKSQSDPRGSIADLGDDGDLLGKSVCDVVRAPVDQISQSGNSNEQKTKGIPRPQTPGCERPFESRHASTGKPRPQSMFVETAHGSPLDDFGSFKAQYSGGRPQNNLPTRSSYSNTPPVPLLPSASEARELERGARRNRRSEGPRVPEGSLSGDLRQTVAPNEPLTKLVRPQSMYEVDIEAMRNHMQRGRSYNISINAPRPNEALDASQPSGPQNDIPQRQRGRTETAIHHAVDKDRSVRPQTTSTYVEAPPALPPLPPAGDLDQWLRHYVRNENQSQSDVFQSNSESDSPVSASTASDHCEAHRFSTGISDGVRVSNKLQKKRPVSTQPDIWKSDSLKEELNKRRTEERTGSEEGSENFEIASPPSGIYDSNGLSVGEIARPVAAPSLHDALRAHKEKMSHSPFGSPSHSGQQTPLEPSP